MNSGERKTGPKPLAEGMGLMQPETLFAKEDKKQIRPFGKTSRLFFFEVCGGLKCGLSGNQVMPSATRHMRL